MIPILEKTKTDNTIRNIYLVAFILLLVSYLITLFANRQLVKQAGRVENTNNVIFHLDDILAKVKDGETGVRGYIMSKDIRFLYPYYGSRELADSHYNKVLALTKDNEVQQDRLKFLKKNVDRRFEQLRFFIESFDDNHREISDSIQKLQPETIRVMDEIRSTISLIEREEHRALKGSEERMKRLFKSINTINIISLTLAFALFLFGLITYVQISKERTKARREIIDYQDQLSNRIDELAKANTELVKRRSEEKFAVTGRIARTIAHEIRNPLTNINLASDQLKDELTKKDEYTEHLFEMINRNSSRINQLISDLLNSTKFSELNFEKIAVNDLLEETLMDAEDRITLSNIKIIKKYSDTVCNVSADKTKLKIAILNIIINAVEAMENRKDSILTLQTKATQEKCIIIISDNGQGMDRESISRVFEPYFTSKSEGTGLGLTNTQNIILNHKGDIVVTSEKGAGTSFTINLDLYKK